MIESIKTGLLGRLGEWWLPQSDEKRVAGVFENREGTLVLRVLGQLAPYRGQRRRQRYAAIRGWIPEIGFVELQECMATLVKYPLAPNNVANAKELIGFRRAICQRVPGELPSRFCSVTLRGPGFHEWMGGSALTVDWDARTGIAEECDGVDKILFTYADPPKIRLLWGSWSVTIWTSVGPIPGHIDKDLHLKQDKFVELTAVADVSLVELDAKRKELSGLLSCLAGDPIEFEPFAVTPIGNGKKPHLDYLVNKVASSGSSRALDPEWIYFSYSELANSLADVLDAWTSLLVEIGAELSDYFIESPNWDRLRRLHECAKYIHAIVEIEARQAGSSSKVPFKDAIEKAVSRYSNIDQDKRSLVVKLAEATRHSLAHPQSVLREGRAEGVELANLDALLDAILRCLVWAKSGIGESLIRRQVLGKSRLRDRLAFDYWVNL